jgi:folate-binding protein YgfZ
MENPIEDSCEDPATGGAYRVPPRVMVRLSGIDAFRYLNGQVTRDLNRLGTAESLPACILTPKGKLCAPLLIHRDGQDLLLEADPALREALVARLERYIVADDVVVSVEEAPLLVHVFGRTLRAEMSAAPEAIRIERLGVPGVDLPADSPLIEGLQLMDPEVVEMIRIGRGISKWGAELTGETLPPEAGLDRTHIDYDRGCYPGQEVVARSQYRGTAKRRTLLFECDAQASAAQEVFHDRDATQPAGMVVNASGLMAAGVAVPSCRALIEVKLSALGDGELHLGAPDGPRLARCAMPYDVPTDTADGSSGPAA